MKTAPSLIMMPFSTVYDVVTRARLAAYRTGLFSVSKLTVPVISVGNITTGGTGKTPLVEWVCRTIANNDDRTRTKICVLTRGYGRANPDTQVLVSNGTEVLADAREAGDEPALLANNLLGIAAVVANPNRVAAGEWAIKNLDAKAVVLDDGFQHLRLARDLDIVAIDATNPFGDGDLLPYGRLREAVSGLARASAVVITRSDQVDNQVDNIATIKQAVRNLAGSAAIFTSRMVTWRFRSITGEEVDKDTVVSQPLAAFCGVGNPASFFTHLQREGCNLVCSRRFVDHHRYTQSDVDALIDEATVRGAKSLVTTAKDAIKLTSLQFRMPCYVLEIRISIDDIDGEDQLARMVHNVFGGN